MSLSDFCMKIIKAGKVKIGDKVKIEGKVKDLTTGFQKLVYTGTTDVKPCKPWDAEIERLKADFAQELQRREETAFERGRAEGRREVEETYRLGEKRKADTLANIIENLNAARRDIIANSEEDLLNLAFTMAEKIVHYKIDSDREVIRHVLQSILKEIVDRNNLIIHLNSDDYHYVMEIKSELLKDFEGIKRISFQEDSAVTRGGAIVETPFGEVDVRIEQQLKEMKNALFNGH